MTKFIGFFIFIVWTGLSALVGFHLSRPQQVKMETVVVENVCEPKEKYTYLVPPDYGCAEGECYGCEDECLEEECDGEDIDWRQYKPRIVVKESKKKNNTQVMLGVQSSGDFEAKFNVPVSDNWGVYVGADTSKNLSVGASFSF
jgi:hypothetical protein